MTESLRTGASREDRPGPWINQEKIPNVCETVGFVSAIGGCGTSSAAIALSRIYSSLFEYKTLYMSLDFMASKAFSVSGTAAVGSPIAGREAIYSLLFENPGIAGKLVRDSFGVFCFPRDGFRNSLHFLAEEQLHKLIEILEDGFDRIVLDIPVNCALSLYAIDICDSLVVCRGWQEERFDACSELFNYLKTSREGVLAFTASFVDGDPCDIYGRFGSEVRELAETIEGR